MGRRGGVHRGSGRPATPPLRPPRATGGSLVPQLPLPRVEARSFQGPCATDSVPPFRCPLVGLPLVLAPHLCLPVLTWLRPQGPTRACTGPLHPHALVCLLSVLAQSPARACGRPRSGSLSERPGGHLHRT